MSWWAYFAKGLGGNKNGSTYANYAGLDATPDEEFGFGDGQNPAWYWETTTTYRPKPHYHAARPAKRWKKL